MSSAMQHEHVVDDVELSGDSDWLPSSVTSTSTTNKKSISLSSEPSSESYSFVKKKFPRRKHVSESSSTLYRLLLFARFVIWSSKCELLNLPKPLLTCHGWYEHWLYQPLYKLRLFLALKIKLEESRHFFQWMSARKVTYLFQLNLNVSYCLCLCWYAEILYRYKSSVCRRF